MGVPRHILNYYGREPIYTDETAVTAENLLDVLQKAFKVHTRNSRLYPIEVKSGTNARLRSLHVFMDNSNIDTAIRVWSNPYSVDKVKTPNGKEYRLINLPFYLIGNLHQVLDEVL